jgi:hypothetical protein
MSKSTSASPDGISIGIDIGGTFTDVVMRTPAASHILKVPTVRAEPGRAVIAALDEIVSRLSVPTSAITSFTHGSTIATNAVLERKGARVGLVTTEGFRDILEIGRQIRRQMYDLNLKPETPGWLAPGARRVEVRERIGSAGEVLVPLDESSLAVAIDKLKAERVEAVAVTLLFSFLNPAHEQRVRAAIEAAIPGVPVSLSSEVDPFFREYERTVVTTFDAYVKPIVRRYLAGFGPASRGDILGWAGLDLPTLSPVLERMKLRRFRDERGGELLDLPRAPLPDADTLAPVRFLPTFDATLLVNCRRTQILPERHRPAIFNTTTPHSVGTLLVDGQVAGTWRTSGDSVEVETFEALPRAARLELKEEKERLREFVR